MIYKPFGDMKHEKVYKVLHGILVLSDDRMVLKNTGTFKLSLPQSWTGIIYVPADMVKDSSFPLKEGKVTVEIQGDSLIVRRA